MESESLINQEAGTAPKANYNTTPAAASNRSEPKFARTIFGVQIWRRFTWLEWLFIVVAAVTVLSILGISIRQFFFLHQKFMFIKDGGYNPYNPNPYNPNFSNNSNSYDYFCNSWMCTNDFIFTVTLVINVAFSLLYVVHGLLQERMFALVAYSVTVVVITVSIIVNYSIKQWSNMYRDKPLSEPFRMTRLILVGVAGPINIVLSSIISYKMGFFIFIAVGVNTTLIRAYKIRSFFLILPILLLQTMANVVALSWFQNGHFLGIPEKVILCVLLVLCVIVIILGFIAVVFENNWLVLVWYFIVLSFYAYFLYKIVDVSVNLKKDYDSKVTVVTYYTVYTDFQLVGGGLISACLLGLILLTLMYLFMALTHRNFRKGLKERVPPPTCQWQDLWLRLSTRLSRRTNTSPIS